VGGPQSRSGHDCEEKNSQSLPGLEPQTIQMFNIKIKTSSPLTKDYEIRKRREIMNERIKRK
jgi:hypothetical protein